MPFRFRDYQPVHPAVYFRGTFHSRFVGEEELAQLSRIMENIRRSDAKQRSLFDLFCFRRDKTTAAQLTQLGPLIENDIRIDPAREFFFHCGQLPRIEPALNEKGETLLHAYLAEIDRQAHIASVGEVLLLIASGLLRPTLTPIYTPFPALTGIPKMPHIWIRLASASRQNKKRHLSIGIVEKPDVRDGQFILFVRAHRVALGVDAEKAYRRPEQERVK